MWFTPLIGLAWSRLQRVNFACLDNTILRAEVARVDFEFDEDQLGLQAAAAEVPGQGVPGVVPALRGRRRPRSQPTVADDSAALDWPGLAIPSGHGGVGASAVELAIVLEQLGYVGDPTPFLATTTQFVPVVARCGDGRAAPRFLGRWRQMGEWERWRSSRPQARPHVVLAVGRWSAAPGDRGIVVARGRRRTGVDGDRAVSRARPTTASRRSWSRRHRVRARRTPGARRRAPGRRRRLRRRVE